MNCAENVIRDKILDIIQETLGISKEDLLLSQEIKELDIDSLDMYEILLRIEEISEKEISTEQFVKFKTINDIIQFFEKN